MRKPTKILFALALGLLVLSFPTCRWGEHTVRYEMTKFPADFVAAHEFDWIFIRWVLPGIGMFFLGGLLSIVAIVFWIVDRSNAKRNTSLIAFDPADRLMNRIKRPPAVWIAQVLLVIFALLLLLSLLIYVTFLLTHITDASSLVPAVVACGVILVMMLLFAFSFWGLVKAKTYGRWLGVSSMVLVWGLSIVGQILRPSGPFKYYEYDNTAQLVGGVVAQLLLDSLFLILILRLAFARKVGEFFHQRASQQIVGPERG